MGEASPGRERRSEARNHPSKPGAGSLGTPMRIRLHVLGTATVLLLGESGISAGGAALDPRRGSPEAQYEYDQSPELQELLARAVSSPTVRTTRTRTS